MTKHFATLDGIKRAAKKLRRSAGISHGQALDRIAQEAGFLNFFDARKAYGGPSAPLTYSVTISEFWSDRSAGTRGNETRSFLLDRPLGDLVKPNHLCGYLGGAKLSGDAAVIAYGDSESQEQARSEICRIARALQFMAATGLKPSRSRRCYPRGDQNNKPPGADHDKGWYDPQSRSYVLTEEPYPGRHDRSLEARAIWARKHGWQTIRSPWGSIYGLGTELYLTAKDGSVDLAALADRLVGLPEPLNDLNWPGDGVSATFRPAAHPDIVEMSSDLTALLDHQRNLDIAEAGPQAPELSGQYRGVEISSRWDIKHELITMRKIVDAMPDLLRVRVQSIWCDSKAQADYSVGIVQGRWRSDIDWEIKDAVRSVTNGFNGLTVADEQQRRFFDADWEGDDYDYSSENAETPAQWGDEDPEF